MFMLPLFTSIWARKFFFKFNSSLKIQAVTVIEDSKERKRKMAKACCVDGCIAKDVVYFRFPNSRTRCKKWMEAVKLSTKPNHNSVLCSAHFSSEDYSLVRGKFRLKAKVVPSLHQLEPHKPIQTTQNSPVEIKDDKTDGTQDRTENISPNNNCEDAVPNGKYPVSNNKENGSVPTGNLKNIKQSKIKKIKHCVKSLSKGRKRKVEEQSESVSQAKKPLVEHEVPEKQDIEEMLTYFHIKQNRDVAERQNAELERERMRQSGRDNGDERSKGTDFIEIDLPSNQAEVDPVFIEIAVSQDNPNGRGSGSPRDCLMVMESLQVELDPNDLLLPEAEEAEVPETIVIDDRPDDHQDDPISLLTSSDEDDVILQEPRIDTVVVSDESESEEVAVVAVGTALLVCPLCGHSTASAAQLSRHRRRHRVERRHCTEQRRTSLLRRLRKHEDAALRCGK